MMLNGSNPTKVHLIRADYGMVDFLINRDQCTSSIFASHVKPIETDKTYLKHVIEVDGEKCLLFDLNRFLMDTFHVEVQNSPQLALLSDLSDFSEASRSLIMEACEDQFNADLADPKRIAFLISSNTVVKEMDIFSLKAHPPVLRSHLFRWGIVATGFDGKKILFLFDIERAISYKLLCRTTRASTTGELT